MQNTNTESCKRERKRLRARLASQSWFYKMFDEVPGVSFFAKNRKGEILFASQGILSRYGFVSEDAILGKTDFDLNPSAFAQQYVRDDKLVYETGKPIKGRLEPWFNTRGLPEWHMTSKYPLCDAKSGEVIGVMGVILQIASSESLPGIARDILPAIKHAHAHFREPICVKQMAELCQCSVRKLQYRFGATLGMSPQVYVMRVRIDRGSEKLKNTDKALSDIAIDCGFSDQSSFTKKFKELMGMTPSAYRKRFASRRSD
ncbi:MAG: helix-turn-helix domain-containing protein [Verrucomicrobiales bacterium]|nr:helix-turn-helix domain-containing protein [Verrucomicrobiales bacterium]